MSAFRYAFRAGKPLEFARAARAVVLVLTGVIVGDASAPSAAIAKLPFPTPFVQAEADAVRLLEQATFGPNDASITQVMYIGAMRWVDEQLAMPPTRYTAFTPWPANRPATCVNDSTLPLTPTSYCQRDNYTLFQLQREFFLNALTAPDQLRQRVAFALSQILVTSGTEISLAYAMQRYQAILSDLAFGNFRDLLTQVTLSPAMGRYLDMVNNLKPNLTTGVEPNENYARELLQLFSLGTVELGLDGAPLLDSYGKTIPSYSQEDVEGFAHVFTGWTYPLAPGATARNLNPTYYDGAMNERSQYHDYSAKTLIDGGAPANLTMSADLANAINVVFNHPNVGPFISKQLIQKLVTGNPSPEYVARVAAVFNNNGAGVRGDLRSVVRAILLDFEARGIAKDDPGYGRLREPAQFVVALARALNTSSDGVFLRAQANAMSQTVFNAPSVFNFYPPDYVVPGTTILGPEFALQNTTTAFARINYVNSLVYSTINPDQTVYGATGTQPNWSALTALAGNPQALVDKLNRLLLHGTMSTAAQSAVVTAINAVSATDALGRAKAAFYLVATSSQYQVER
jgi:uncharacterized protein (DUF1800 family)